MNKDIVVATYSEELSFTEYSYREVAQFDDYLPYWIYDINSWVDYRQIGKHRHTVETIMRRLGIIARAVMTPAIRAKLVELRDFEYTDPGFDYPKWKLDAVNRLKNRQIEALLA